jgi:hypothetical protein
MTLEEIFAKKQFLKFRETKLTESDEKFLLLRLSEYGIYDVLPFLRVATSVPKELLKPIIIEVLDYEDISLPKRYMDIISRLFTPENVLECLLNIISDNELLKTKCKAAGILSFIGGFMFAKGRDECGKILWKCGTDYIWDGSKYERKCIEGDINLFINRSNSFKSCRTKAVVNEFLKNENIVLRYYLLASLYDKLEDYPTDIKNEAQQVIEIICEQNFPKNASELISKVLGDLNLEKLLFEELKWQRK